MGFLWVLLSRPSVHMPWSRVLEFEGIEETHFVVRFRSGDGGMGAFRWKGEGNG